MEIIHYALKIQPIEHLAPNAEANARITAVFSELLERQFPIESTSQRFSLRSPKDFADRLSIHVNHLNRALRTTTGKTTSALIFERLIAEAVALLKHTDWNISESVIALVSKILLTLIIFSRSIRHSHLPRYARSSCLKFASIGFRRASKGTVEVLSFVSSITIKAKLMKNNVWFVTGASKGLGLSLVKKLLQEGFNVVATSRNVEELKTAVGINDDRFLPIAMNLLDEMDVDRAIKKTIDHFGSIDVVVNNAGYGLVGGLEELSDAEVRMNFEVNVFGALHVIRKALPHLRRQQRGHIFNIASVGGFVGTFPGFGIYCATKFAMHGYTEALATEVKPFGIQVTVVSPGYFRTNFLESSSLQVPANPINDYRLIREAQNLHQVSINGKQTGDPDKAASVLIEVAAMKAAPLHLFLGADAYQFAEQKIASLRADMLSVEDLATTTAFEENVVAG